MHPKELRDLTISALVLAFLFAYQGFGALDLLILNFPIALLAISLGFLGHELAHRYVAMRNGCRAEYKMWPQGLGLALVLALLTDGRMVFAAPGAVVIYPLIDLWGRRVVLRSDQELRIALAGPMANVVIGFCFFALYLLSGNPILEVVARINAWLATFNLLPLHPLDGAKIWKNNRHIWIISMAIALLLYLLYLLLFFL